MDAPQDAASPGMAFYLQTTSLFTGRAAMKRYWDLSEKERSELSTQDVDNLCDVELMEQGIVRVDPPAEIEAPEIPPPDLTVYVVKCGYGDRSVCYRNIEDAQRAMAGAEHMDSDYIGGKSFDMLGSNHEVKSPAIEEKRVYLPSTIANHRALIEKAESAKKANEKAKKEYQESCKAVQVAVDGLWSDYRACCEKAYRLMRIITVFGQYVTMADGDTDVARRFLAKAYDEQDIAAAFEWYPQGELAAA